VRDEGARDDGDAPALDGGAHETDGGKPAARSAKKDAWRVGETPPEPKAAGCAIGGSARATVPAWLLVLAGAALLLRRRAAR
jgi:hypothetical protein